MKLQNQTWAITGSFPFASREEIESLLKSEGAQITGNVRKATNLLVGKTPGTKLLLAEDLGVKICGLWENLTIPFLINAKKGLDPKYTLKSKWGNTKKE